ncbi:MAG: hypothetical protein DWQ01_04805 [Planctomycetota bacterium]|nr:MAG: hypothetical protein DWQ01_04805 [Planctomycetota bacterium]
MNSEPAPVQVQGFQVSYELVRRKHLLAAGLKVPAYDAYHKVWVVSRQDGQGQWRPSRYFLEQAEAMGFAEGGGKDED